MLVTKLLVTNNPPIQYFFKFSATNLLLVSINQKCSKDLKNVQNLKNWIMVSDTLSERSFFGTLYKTLNKQTVHLEAGDINAQALGK